MQSCKVCLASDQFGHESSKPAYQLQATGFAVRCWVFLISERFTRAVRPLLKSSHAACKDNDKRPDGKVCL